MKNVKANYTGIFNKSNFGVIFSFLPDISFTQFKFTTEKYLVIFAGWLCFNWRVEIKIQ